MKGDAMKKITRLLLITTMLAAFLFFPGCGDDNETNEPPTGNYAAVVWSFGFNTPVEGALVTLMNNTTGEATTTTATTDADGKFEMTVPTGGSIGFKVTKAEHWDTYQFNLDPKAEDETIWIVNNMVVDLNTQSSGLTLEPGNGVVAGACYFVEQGEELPVGCASVDTEPTGDIRYFFFDTGSMTFYAVPLAVRSTTDPHIGYFLAANIPAAATPTPVTMTAEVESAAAGTVNLFVYENAICISNIYCSVKTPTGCQ
jgi:hypothetical protein